MSYLEIIAKILPIVVKILAAIAQILLGISSVIAAWKGRKIAKETVNEKRKD